MKNLTLSRIIFGKIFFIVMSIALTTGCSTNKKNSELESVPEIYPGMMKGYLNDEEVSNSLSLLPPPPAADSTAFALDADVSQNNLTLQGSARWKLATEDANLKFPEVANTFSCALNAPITKEGTPQLYRLLRRTLADAGFSSFSAKNHYKRPRPFTVNKQATCTPNEEKRLIQNGSYPSGHTSIGWAWGLILSQLSPEHSDALLARGRAFGQSRMICNVHWQSDVLAGQMMGSATVARLQSNPAFLAAINAARIELTAIRAKGLPPLRDCQDETQALTQHPPLAPWPANK